MQRCRGEQSLEPRFRRDDEMSFRAYDWSAGIFPAFPLVETDKILSLSEMIQGFYITFFITEMSTTRVMGETDFKENF